MMLASHSEHLQTGAFRRLVFLYMLQALVFSVTGMIDCAFVGRYIGAAGLAGMKLAMPVFAVLYLLFGSILSTGLSVRVSGLIAEGKRSLANQSLLWVCAVSAGISILLLLAALLMPDFLTRIFAGRVHDQAVYAHTKAYLIPILIGSLPVILHSILSAVAALEGANRRMTVSVAVVLVVDLAGDLVAVKLDSGLWGIAIASIAAYLGACVVLAGHFLTDKTVFRPERLRFEKGLLRGVVIAGLPMAVKGVCEFLCPMAVNRLMLRYGSVNGLAALSIQDAAHYLPLAFCEGLAAAVLLLTGMLAAEQDGEALRNERRTAVRYAIVQGTVWTLLLFAAAPLLLWLFTNNTALRELSLSAFRWFLVGVPFASLNYVERAYLQGMGRERAASLFTLVNQLFLPVLFAWVLGSIWGIKGIFAAFAIHEILLAVCFFLFRHLYKGSVEEEGWSPVRAELRRELVSVDQVVDASEAVLDLCAGQGVDRKTAYHIALCLEELGTNTIRHGFNSRKSGTGRLDCRFLLTDRDLILRMRDNGRPFDLTERWQLLNPEEPTSHLGLRMIFAAAEHVNYSRSFDLNNVCIRVSKTGGKSYERKHR